MDTKMYLPIQTDHRDSRFLGSDRSLRLLQPGYRLVFHRYGKPSQWFWTQRSIQRHGENHQEKRAGLRVIRREGRSSELLCLSEGDLVGDSALQHYLGQVCHQYQFRLIIVLSV